MAGAILPERINQAQRYVADTKRDTVELHRYRGYTENTISELIAIGRKSQEILKWKSSKVKGG